MPLFYASGLAAGDGTALQAPTGDGTAGQALTSDGAGQFTFTTLGVSVGDAGQISGLDSLPLVGGTFVLTIDDLGQMGFTTFALPWSSISGNPSDSDAVSAFTETLWTLTTAADYRSSLSAAAATHTHAASDVTSGTFADARIAASNVTQHQAALSITESQISDLDHDAVKLRTVSLDATVATPSDGDILVYRAAGLDWVLEAKPAGGSNPALNDVTDVNITSVGDNEVLAYDTTTGDWINQTAAEAGLAAATHTHSTADITSGTLPVANGGTGSATAATARTALGLAIGSDVQAHDAGLDALAALTTTNTIYYLSDTDVWTAVTIGSGLSFTTGTLSATGGGGGAVNDLSDATITTPADNEVLAYDNGTSEWINQTAAEAGLAAASHTHAASDVASGTFADARIAASNVTQHQASLSITESQISNLGTAVTLNADADVSGNSWVLDEDTMTSNSATKVPTQQSVKAYVDAREKRAIPLLVSAFDSDLTVGTAKLTFRMPFAFTLSAVRASVSTAATGTAITVDINETAVSILSTKLTIDASEKTSTTAATPAVISDTALADDAEITIDVDGTGTGARGLIVYLIGTET